MSPTLQKFYQHRICSSLILSITLIGFIFLFAEPVQGQMSEKKKKKMIKKMKSLAPAKGYVKAHKNLESPHDLLGGPVNINIEQNNGGVFVGLPDKRDLDTYVFGLPKLPRAYGGTPGINGLPPKLRAKKGGKYTKMKKKSPFGDKHIVLPNGNLTIKATDKTATDAAKTEDEVKFEASWEDKEGNTYTVRCCKMMAKHGMEYPTFGGVVTNHILHGFTRIGTALMPSEFTYFAFWGMGAVLKNGDVQEKPRLIHGMLTEYVRKDDYKLAKDEEITPGQRHFHLMVPPMMPVKEKMTFTHKDVPTGFELKNGMELPFWHVMFENLDINASR